MPTYHTPKRGVAFKMYIGLVDQSNTKLLKANPTIASGDFQISKDGGAFANLTTLPSANPASGRAVMIDLSASEMTADNIVIQCVDASGAEWCDQIINLQTTASQLDDLATAANLSTVLTNLSTIAGYIDTEVAAIKAKTDLIPASPAAVGDIPTAAAVADAVWDEAVDSTITARQSIRLANSALGGKASGLNTTTAVYRDLADTKDRISATVDADGNRTAVTRDLS